jgi:hypothetical protein
MARSTWTQLDPRPEQEGLVDDETLIRALIERMQAQRPEGVTERDVERYARRHRAALLLEARRACRDDITLFEVYQRQATPDQQERGHREEERVAEGLLANARALVTDPEFAAIYNLEEREGDGDPWSSDWDEEDETTTFGVWERRDMPELLLVPDVHDRMSFADALVNAALAVNDGLPDWLGVAIVEDWLHQRPMRLVAVDKETAVDFVNEHHSKLPALNPRGLMYAIGVVEAATQRLVAVATAGSPTGRWREPRRVLELTRVASDGTVRGAASMLVARLIDLLPRSTRGPTTLPALFVTYSLASEAGHALPGTRSTGRSPLSASPR